MTSKQIQLNILEVKKPEIDAQLVAQGVRRAAVQPGFSFRRAMRKAISECDEEPGVQGDPGAVLRSPRRRGDVPPLSF